MKHCLTILVPALVLVLVACSGKEASPAPPQAAMEQPVLNQTQAEPTATLPPPTATIPPLPTNTAVPPTQPPPPPTATRLPPTPIPLVLPTVGSQTPPPCHPSYQGGVDVARGGCIRAGLGDYDCAGGTGNGPNYVRGPVRVVGPDAFDLDRDNDGIACER